MQSITNLLFIATLLHLKPHQLTYSEVLALLQHWRGKPLLVNCWKGGKRNGVRPNFYGTQYLSVAPKRGGRYKKQLWDSTNRRYHLLVKGNNYLVPATSVDELMSNYQHKSEA